MEEMSVSDKRAESPDEILDKHRYKEIGNLASWTVSSEKAGFEIDTVRDDNLDTYWQYACASTLDTTADHTDQTDRSRITSMCTFQSGSWLKYGYT
jgi:hypothetical protein